MANRGNPAGGSIFDPLLCELVYRWFCTDNGLVLDPFAGGSVRGIVASVLGLDYYGIDLAEEQIKANIVQGQEVCDKMPTWYHGDSNQMDNILPEGLKFDLVFSCPPYHNLEKYTDDMDDLSNMSWGTFKTIYKAIIEKSILRLKANRFACFVVSEIRDDNGGYRGLVPWTINCFQQGGMWYYNEMILVNALGSLPVRIAKQFGSHRKIGRTHQNILIFYKGDIEAIPRHYKQIDTGMP